MEGRLASYIKQLLLKQLKLTWLEVLQGTARIPNVRRRQPRLLPRERGASRPSASSPWPDPQADTGPFQAGRLADLAVLRRERGPGVTADVPLSASVQPTASGPGATATVAPTQWAAR